MNYRKYKHGLLEKTLITAIILATAIFALDAYAMDLRTLYPLNDSNLNIAKRLMRNDVNLSITVMVYSPEWTVKGSEHGLIGKAMETSADLFKEFGSMRVNTLFANEAGLKDDAMPTPEAAGIYLYLE